MGVSIDIQAKQVDKHHQLVLIQSPLHLPIGGLQQFVETVKGPLVQGPRVLCCKVRPVTRVMQNGDGM